jgi:hypothetical protein
MGVKGRAVSQLLYPRETGGKYRKRTGASRWPWIRGML